MDQRLVDGDWAGLADGEEGAEKEDEINRLASQVEHQRQLRLADARQVEAKAARIKEWVTNKLRELEAQNQHLREQNHRCNQQLELLRKHMADLATRHNAASSQSLVGGNDCLESGRKEGLGHRRNLSADSPLQLSSDLQAAVDSLALLPLHLSRKSEVMDSEQCHDYAEIYTPSAENASWDVQKPPTPPLHRFPSWESRIYAVASEGLAPASAAESHSGTGGSRGPGSSQLGYREINVPVYATVKGRASQIRSMPFTGDSSDDSSDGEDHTININTSRITNSSSDNTDTSLSSSSPSKCQVQTTSTFSPAKPSSTVGSQNNWVVESSEDYAVPPDAVSCDSAAVGGEWGDWGRGTSPRSNLIDKSGYLAKLGGKLKTWTKRWFHLDNTKLTYWKHQNEVNRKPQGEISIDENCRIIRAEGAATFEVATDKKTYYLTADSLAATEEWVKLLLSVQRRNATKLLLSKDTNKPTIQGWLTKVRNGHAKKCWCVLLGKTFLYFKAPSDTTALGQINMRDARVEEVDHVSDSDSEDRDSDNPHLTIGIFPTHQPSPTYLLLPNKQEKDSWLYHLTIVSGGGSSGGTQYEQLVQKLMEVDGDPSCVLWRHPLLLHTKENITSSLTTLSSESLQQEAIKLFKSCLLYTSVAVESAGIDYHVVLAQNAMQQCLDQWELQAELICALVKQTSRHTAAKTGVQVTACRRIATAPRSQLQTHFRQLFHNSSKEVISPLF